MEKKQIIILVEGNIGSGKTTLLKWVQGFESERIKVFTEPMDQWRNFEGVNVLEEYYKDFNCWSMKFQLLALLTIGDRMNDLREINFMERSPISSMEVFAKRLHEEGFLDKIEMGLLEKTREMISKNFKPDVIIYNKTAPERCLERIKIRDRAEDLEQLTPDFIQELHDRHEELFGQECLEWKGFKIPIYVFESPDGIEKVPTKLEELFKKIEQDLENFKI